jgi:hypothetical protein
MTYDEKKVDEMVLALLFLTTYRDGDGMRAWKGHDWSVLDRLHEHGYISEPRTKAKSVWLTEAGAKLSKNLFELHFSALRESS